MGGHRLGRPRRAGIHLRILNGTRYAWPVTDANDTPRTPALGPPPQRRGLALASGVLVFTLLLTFVGWRYASDKETATAQARFIGQGEEAVSLLRERMGNQEIVLRGAASLFASVQRPTPYQWQAYADGMRLQRQFPAMVGLGYAAYVEQARLPTLQLEWKALGYGQLDVVPHGPRPDYGPIMMLEPRTPQNVAAIGYDMYSQPVRRAAMEAAMQTGQVRMSGPVQLVQDGNTPSTSALLYLPLYRNGAQPNTVPARREAMLGWVYTPFRFDEFVHSTLGERLDGMQFTLTDITDEPGQRLYGSGDASPDARFRFQTQLAVHGRRWLLEFASTSPEDAQAVDSMLWGGVLFGVISSLLLATIVFTLVRTERRAMKMALRMSEEYRRSEERFRTTMLHSGIGKALLDSEGCVVECNPALGRIVGLSPAALSGVEFESLFEDEGPDLGEWLKQDDLEAAPVIRITRRLHRAGDLARHAQLTYARVPGGVGQDVIGLVQAEDVTERILAEARVHALNRTLEARVAARTRELSQANQELESFAYSISHDLRAPLRAIDGFSRIIADKYREALDATANGYLSRIRAAATRMDELIDALLKMSRVTRTEVNPRAIDLSQMASELLEEFRAGDPEHRPRVDIAPQLRAWGDPVLMRNLLANLLGNAWKFTRGKPDPWIEFGAHRLPSGTFEFHVRDNGAGFPQQHVEKLFRPFQRLHGQEEFAGHGIGLASVKRIIERHGGTIRAEGVVGEGAAFYFALPDATEGGAAV